MKKKKALRSFYQKIQQETKNLINQAILKSTALSHLIEPHQQAPFKVMSRLVDEYNLNLAYVREIIDVNFLIKIEPYKFDSGDMYGQLYRLITECEKIISLLEEDRVREVQQYINQLKSLEDEIEKLDRIEFGIKKNIIKSVDLFERGEIICSTFFASRIISYLIAQFDIDEKLIKENNAKKSKESRVSLIIKDCIAKGLINKENKQYINNLLQYINLARNKLIHEILFFPEAAECLGILSNTIELIKLKDKFDEYLTKQNEKLL
ncbi:MAG: hypothetical protein ACFE9T_15510 [Promethearchaeota archaeon]